MTELPNVVNDKVHPSHYRGFSNGASPWDIAERLNYNRGTALVYIARAGRKPGESALDDLMKARRYLDREIDRIIADGREAPAAVAAAVSVIRQTGSGRGE